MAFTREERQDLADALAAVSASAELLGRARIRKRQEMAAKHAEDTISIYTRRPQARFNEQYATFSDTPTSFEMFDESIVPLQPSKALEWFQSLFPSLSVEPAPWLKGIERRAFQLAVTTEETILARVHSIIEDALRGKAAKGPALIQQVLDEAGCSPANPQYAEMCFRTSMMDSFVRGSQEELKEVADDFPVWRYLGIDDGRQGKDHEPHFNQYYPSSVDFTEVRGERLFNCRCAPQAIYKRDWQRLKEQGARIAEGWER